MSTPVTALIVTYYTGPVLKLCLYALLSDPQIGRIVLVNNGNTEDVLSGLRQLSQKYPSLELIDGQGNIGFGAGINLAARQVRHGDLLIINPDAILKHGSAGQMQKLGQTLQTPWIIGGRIFDIHGQEARGGRRRLLTPWRALTSLLGLNSWTLEKTQPPTRPVSMPVISGAFFLTSKQSFDQLGGFDEGYFLHFEDVDLCRRCWQAGGQIMYEPRAGSLHYGSTSRVSPKLLSHYKLDSLQRYFRKFSPVSSIGLALIMPGLLGALWLRHLFRPGHKI